MLPELPLTMALPSTLGQIYERVHISEKNPGPSPFISKVVHVSLLLHEKDCPLQFHSKPLLFLHVVPPQGTV